VQIVASRAASQADNQGMAAVQVWLAQFSGVICCQSPAGACDSPWFFQSLVEGRSSGASMSSKDLPRARDRSWPADGRGSTGQTLKCRASLAG
jgi:hypothetical protein